MSFKYEYTRLLVSNFRECFLFYRDVMGFRAGFGAEDGTYAVFPVGEVNIALFDRQEMSENLGTAHKAAHADAQDRVALIFAVDDVDEACQQLTERGVSFVVGPTDHPDWGIRTAHFRDPDGNLIEINHPLQY
jgi:lactoylglutathione lyase